MKCKKIIIRIQNNKPIKFCIINYYKKYYRNDLGIKRGIEFLDFNTYLPEHALTRVDRNSILFGLECRVPFLSNNMINLAFSIDPNKKYNY